MKKIYTTTILVLVAFCGWAQSFTVSGPRTIFNLAVAATSATDPNRTYFSFDKGKAVTNTDAWDISFRGYYVNLNTGVEGQIVSSTSFATTTTAPSAGYATTVSYAATTTDGFYNYNTSNNVVTVVPGKLLLLKLADGRFVKVEFLSYYQHAPINAQDFTTPPTNTSRVLSFRYLVSSAGSDDLSQMITKISNLKVPAASATTYQMVNLAAADTTATATDKWHIRIKGTTVQTNNATNGVGGNASQFISTDFNAVTTAPTVADGSISWYTYEGDYTHTISANAGTMVFKDTLGRNGKLFFQSYYKNAPEVVCTGSGYYTFSYYYNPYGAGESASGRDGNSLSPTATIVQSVSPTLSLSSSTLPVVASGITNESITVTSNDTWTASTTDSWLSLGNETATGNAAFTITSSANANAARTGTVTVTYCNGGAKTVTVNQTAATTAIMDGIYGKVKIYPNPSSDKFNVDLGTTTADALSVLSLEGKEMFTVVSPASSDFSINAEQWKKGMYFLKISSSEGVFYKMIELQ